MAWVKAMSVSTRRHEDKVVVQNLQVAKVGLAAHEVDRGPSGVRVGWYWQLRPSIVLWRHVDHEEFVPDLVEFREGTRLCKASRIVPPRNEKSNL